MRKLLSTAVAVGIFTSTSLLPAAYASLPTDYTVPAHGTTFTYLENDARNSNVLITKPNDTTVNVQIDPANKAQWATGTAHFTTANLGEGGTFNVEFTNNYQTSLNYVDAAGGASKIFGNITSSSCATCTGYDFTKTGKIMIINPNGFIFGNGANVDVNSFTASTLNPTLPSSHSNNKENWTFTSNDGTPSGITVLGGAKLGSDKTKSINLVTDGDLITYSGSAIKTNYSSINSATNTNGVDNVTAGNVRLITTDGVTFTYRHDGNVDNTNPVFTGSASTKKMTLSLNGDIETGNVYARNHSSNTGSEFLVNGAAIKAHRAVAGNDGMIQLISDNVIKVNNANIKTEKNTGASVSNDEGTILVQGAKGVQLTGKNGTRTNQIDAVNRIVIRTTNAGAGGDVTIDNTNVRADKQVLIQSRLGDATIQNGSNVEGQSVTVTANNDLSVKDSTVTAKGTSEGDDVSLTATNGTTWVNHSTVTSQKDIKAVSTNGLVAVDGVSTLNASRDINLTGKTGVEIGNSSSDKLTAGQDINITSSDGYFQAKNSTLAATRNINVTTKKNIDSNYLTSSTFTANSGNINLTSNGTTANDDTVGNILLSGTDQFRTPATTGRLNLNAAKNVQIIKDGALTVAKTNITAGDDVLIRSGKQDGTLTNTLTVDSTTGFAGADSISLEGQNVYTSGTVNMNSLKTNLIANNEINATLSGVDNTEKGLTASSGGNMTISAKNASGNKGTLAVSSLISKANMTLDANSIVKGKSYMSKNSSDALYVGTGGFTDTTSDRSYIEVEGTFTSTPNFTIQESKEKTTDGLYYKRHHIQYGSSDNGKIYLVNKQKVNDTLTPATLPGVNDIAKVNVTKRGTTSLGGGTGIGTAGTGATPTPYNPNGGSNPGGGNPGGGNPGGGDCVGGAVVGSPFQNEGLEDE